MSGWYHGCGMRRDLEVPATLGIEVGGEAHRSRTRDLRCVVAEFDEPWFLPAGAGSRSPYALSAGNRTRSLASACPVVATVRICGGVGFWRLVAVYAPRSVLAVNFIVQCFQTVGTMLDPFRTAFGTLCQGRMKLRPSGMSYINEKAAAWISTDEPVLHFAIPPAGAAKGITAGQWTKGLPWNRLKDDPVVFLYGWHDFHSNTQNYVTAKFPCISLGIFLTTWVNGDILYSLINPFGVKTG